MERYHKPTEMPGGFWDALRPLAQWILTTLQDTYRQGYFDGCADATADFERHTQKPRIFI